MAALAAEAKVEAATAVAMRAEVVQEAGVMAAGAMGEAE